MNEVVFRAALEGFFFLSLVSKEGKRKMNEKHPTSSSPFIKTKKKKKKKVEVYNSRRRRRRGWMNEEEREVKELAFDD